MRRTLDKMEDWANGTLQLTNLSDSDLSNIIVALGKQVANKPDLWGDGYSDGVLVYDMYNCPNCVKSYELDYEQYDYCPNCGQKLDWTVLEGEEADE